MRRGRIQLFPQAATLRPIIPHSARIPWIEAKSNPAAIAPITVSAQTVAHECLWALEVGRNETTRIKEGRDLLRSRLVLV
jgi:hypothetical protein